MAGTPAGRVEHAVSLARSAPAWGLERVNPEGESR